MFTFDPHLGVPIYRQLVEQVRRMAASGLLQPGDELPSVRDLAVTHAVNPMTISKAYGILESEGLLLRQRGKPMQIADSIGSHESEKRRVEHLLPQLAQLALAAQQLQLRDAILLDALRAQLAQLTREPSAIRVGRQEINENKETGANQRNLCE